MPEIIKLLVNQAHHTHPHGWKRVRFAVTPAEYEEIRKYFLETEGRFFGQIRGYALVIEEHPEERHITYESSLHA